MKVERIIEAILFAASRPLALDEIAEAMKMDRKEVKKAIEKLKKFYEDSAIEIAEVNEKYVMEVKAEYVEYAKKFAPVELKKSLIKTLSLIAYHQPIKQSDLKKMIGSNVYEYVRELKKKGFINTKKEGRTKMITTTQYFYDYFGIDKKDKEAIKKMMK
ncbi:MAG: SMC-Scp complex subunit ScpB [Thermoplasmata archaeon]|nr:MAG: SMC-Scp complex subunit ScpB [Thermoplasmata archaeon]KAA0009371.1 MAG: SMC-Scp complex subunit ScpB [Thermoplasmata archaeon]MCD6573950.1 SMC-Scp complex subunit ScpB [Thermoplasmata archaeon]